MKLNEKEQKLLPAHKQPTLLGLDPTYPDRYLNKLHLVKICKQIYCLKVKDVWSRGHIFLRYQEYYENGNDIFRGHDFKIEDFMKWYKEEFNNEYFSYSSDWSGFNIPSEIIESCSKNIQDFNEYDKIMLSIYDTIRKEEKDKFYLIGTDMDDGSLLHHEVAHGMYYTNDKYKRDVLSLIHAMPQRVHTRLCKRLLNTGCYAENVLDDEIQAYISTGYLMFGMERYARAFRRRFVHYYKELDKDAIKVKVDYSKYFTLKKS